MKYKNEQDRKFHEKYNSLLNELPQMCRGFFTGREINTSVRTRIGYAYDLKLFFTFLTLENPVFEKIGLKNISFENIESLTTDDIEEYMHWLSGYVINEKYYSNQEESKARKLCSLNTFFKFNVKRKKLPSNPIAVMDSVNVHEKDIIRMDKSEENEFLNAVEYGTGLTSRQLKFHTKNKYRDYAIFTLFLATGLRVSELTGIDLDNISWKEHKIGIIRKGGNYASIYMSDEAEKILKEYIDNYREFYKPSEEEKAVFLSMRGNRISVRNVEVITRKYAKIAVPLKKITPHKMRTTYGTQLYEITNDISLVGENLGHKSIDTTKKHYASVSEERKKQSRNTITLENRLT